MSLTLADAKVGDKVKMHITSTLILSPYPSSDFIWATILQKSDGAIRLGWKTSEIYPIGCDSSNRAIHAGNIDLIGYAWIKWVADNFEIDEIQEPIPEQMITKSTICKCGISRVMCDYHKD